MADSPHKRLRAIRRTITAAGGHVTGIDHGKHIKVHFTNARGEPKMLVTSFSPSDFRATKAVASNLRKLLSFSVCVLAALILLTHFPLAHGAEFRAEARGPGEYRVFVTGHIDANDDTRFLLVLSGLHAKKAIVDLDSNGGNLVAGLAIARTVRERHFDTWVGDRRLCSSACAAIWLAGATHWSAPTSRIGFHQPYMTDGSGVKSFSPGGIDMLWKFYREIGLQLPTIEALLKPGPEDALWLTAEKAKSLGLDFGTGS